MTIVVEIPGVSTLRLHHLLLDVNGTLTNRGTPIAGIRERLVELSSRLDLRLLSADTYGTLDDVAARLAARFERVETGAGKVAAITSLGAQHCAAIGNGANDAGMVDAARLGIAVVGPEGAAEAVVRAADVVCTSILDALDLLLDERALVATLRI